MNGRARREPFTITRRMTTVTWRKNDDDPGSWRIAEFSDARDADWFAERLLSHGAVEQDSITIATKVDTVYP